MLRARVRSACRLALILTLFSSLAASGQEQAPDETNKKWLDCDLSWIYTSETVGHDFSVKLTFRNSPIQSVQIVLVPGEMVSDGPDGGLVPAKAETDSAGVAHFFGVPAGRYWAEIENGLLFSEPEVKVVEDLGGDQELPFDWPIETLPVRRLRGRLTTAERLVDRSVPLSDTKVELLDLYTGRSIEQTTTDDGGFYSFSCADQGIYALRVTPPKKTDVNELSEEIAVELVSTAKLPSIPQMKVMQSHCGGVQLFRLHRGRSGSKIEDWGHPY